MAELAWCPTCQRWDNLELREAVCDREGNLVCLRCDTVLEKSDMDTRTNLEEEYQKTAREYKLALLRYYEARGTPSEDEEWRKSRQAYWNMRRVVRRLYEARTCCQS